MRFRYSRSSSEIADTFSDEPAALRQICLPESAETFRAWNISFRLNRSDDQYAGQRKEPEVSANHRFHGVSRMGVARASLLDGTEGLLLAESAAFSLVSASNGLGGGRDGSGKVQPEALYRGRGGPAHRNLPRPLTRSRPEQTSRQTCPGSLSCGRGSREVAFHEFRSDDPHGSASALSALVFPLRRFCHSVTPTARICISVYR